MIRPLATITFCTFLSTWQFVTVSLAACADCNLRMQQIAQGQGQAPFAYRLLAPHIIMAMGNTPQALTLFHMVMFTVFFSLLWVWARRWDVPPLPVLFVAALALVVMMPTYYFSAWAILEWDIWLIGLLSLPRWSLSGLLTEK